MEADVKITWNLLIMRYIYALPYRQGRPLYTSITLRY